MGKASSAKKVARAARAGGSARQDRPKLAFPLAIIAVIVLGTVLVVYARSTNVSSASAAAKPSSTTNDHWHAAYGFYVCDKFLAPLKDASDSDPLGIHTHGDGLMHIHPFSAASSGTNARMSVWGKQVGVEFTNDGWKMPDGTEYKKGSAKCGDQPARIAVYKFKAKDLKSPVEVFDENFANINFTEDNDAYTFAVMPQNAAEPAPRPESIPQLDQLNDVDQGSGGSAGETAPGAAGAGQTPPGSTP